MHMRTGFFLMMVLASLPLSAGEKQASGLLDPDISYVVSGYGEASGQFRVVVMNVGWEHVSSRLRLEWLAEGPAQTWIVQKSVAVAEFDGRMLSIGVPVWVPEQSQIIINATHTYSSEEYKFTLTPLASGQYELKSE
ncbi:MAG: hypothetical protein ABI644_07560 [Arenimonas sp.]